MAHEGDTATLSVSLGKLPAVRGLSADDARAALTDAGLVVAGDVIERPDEELEAFMLDRS